MCLIVFGWQVHPDYPLVVAANRDELYDRPTQPATRWPEHSQVIAGIDLQAGGTWLGVTGSGRFAAVTNVREPGMKTGARSRGALTRDFLLSERSPEAYAHSVDGKAYAGFNLLLSDGQSMIYCSNRTDPPQRLAPGIYGLSNHLLDSAWPKLVKARTQFSSALEKLPDESAMFELLSDREIVADADLPDTGVPLAWERVLSAVFVQSEGYGTRASSVVMQQNNGTTVLSERSFGSDGQLLQSSVISTSV